MIHFKRLQLFLSILLTVFLLVSVQKSNAKEDEITKHPTTQKEVDVDRMYLIDDTKSEDDGVDSSELIQPDFKLEELYKADEEKLIKGDDKDKAKNKKTDD